MKWVKDPLFSNTIFDKHQVTLVRWHWLIHIYPNNQSTFFLIYLPDYSLTEISVVYNSNKPCWHFELTTNLCSSVVNFWLCINWASCQLLAITYHWFHGVMGSPLFNSFSSLFIFGISATLTILFVTFVKSYFRIPLLLLL